MAPPSMSEIVLPSRASRNAFKRCSRLRRCQQISVLVIGRRSISVEIQPYLFFAPSLFVEEEAPRPKGRSLLDLQAALSSALVTRQMQLVEKECVLCGYATLCEARTLD